MSIPTRLSSVVARQASRQTLPAARAPLAVQQQKRTRADASTSHAEFKSPFTRGTGNSKDTTVIPSFKKYKNGNETTNKVFQYFMVGALGGLSALGAKNTVQGRSQWIPMRGLEEQNPALEK
jgi:ubiquinol-cytochrome c reductase iron-sulfur subunit